MGENENEFDASVDYTKKGETYIRDNYKAWIVSLPQKKIFQMLVDSCEDSELELRSWDRETLAEFMCTIKYGKEKD